MPALHLCPACHGEFSTTRSNKRYCTPRCAAHAAAQRGHRFRTRSPRNNSTAGYGSTHQKARKAAALRHQPSDRCTVCRQPLGEMGPWLHYDHTGDRTGYLGFAHARCNSVKGARVGGRQQHLRRAQSRQWGGTPNRAAS